MFDNTVIYPGSQIEDRHHVQQCRDLQLQTTAIIYDNMAIIYDCKQSAESKTNTSTRSAPLRENRGRCTSSASSMPAQCRSARSMPAGETIPKVQRKPRERACW